MLFQVQAVIQENLQLITVVKKKVSGFQYKISKLTHANVREIVLALVIRECMNWKITYKIIICLYRTADKCINTRAGSLTRY